MLQSSSGRLEYMCLISEQNCHVHVCYGERENQFRGMSLGVPLLSLPHAFRVHIICMPSISPTDRPHTTCFINVQGYMYYRSDFPSTTCAVILCQLVLPRFSLLMAPNLWARSRSSGQDWPRSTSPMLTTLESNVSTCI